MMYGGLFQSFLFTCYLISSKGALYLSLCNVVCAVGLKLDGEAVSYRRLLAPNDAGGT